MKIPSPRSLVTGFFGLALVALSSSCADPYYSSGHHPRPSDHRHGPREIRVLPSGYRTEVIGGTRYYSHNGTYYRSQSGKYIIVDAPHRPGPGRPNDFGRPPSKRPSYDQPPGRGDAHLNKLPSGYRTVNHGGNRYYQVNGRYYQKRGNQYILVDRPR
jgi:hypothetical protein